MRSILAITRRNLFTFSPAATTVLQRRTLSQVPESFNSRYARTMDELLAASRNGQFDKVIELYELNLSKEEFTCINVFHNLALKAFVRQGNVQRAQEIFKQMQDEGRVDRHTKGNFLPVLVDQYRLDEAVELLLDGSCEFPPAGVMVPLVKALSQSPHHYWNAVQLLRVSTEQGGCQFLPATYNYVMLALLRYGRLDDAVRLIDGWLLSKTSPVDPAAAGSVLKAMVGAGKFNEAVATFERLGQSEVPMDTVCYANAIKAYGSIGLMEEAKHVLAEFCSGSVEANNALVSVYLGSEKMEEALQHVVQMTESGVTPNLETYLMFVVHHLKNGHVESALEMWERMLEQQIVPDTQAYNRLLGGLKGDQALFDKYFLKMVEAGCPPNDVTIEICWEMMCRAGNFEAARKMYDELPEQDKEKFQTRNAFALLVEGSLNEGNFQGARELKQQYESKRHKRTNRALMELFERLEH